MTARIDATSLATLDTAIRAAAANHADSRVVVASMERGRTATLAQLVAEATQVAAWLQQNDVGKGDTVAFALPNWSEALVIQAAALLAGAGILPIVPIYGAREVAFILNDSGASTVVLPTSFRGRDYRSMMTALTTVPTLQRVVFVGDIVPDGALTWDSVHAEASTYVLPDIAPEDRALTVYTSGTTSNPKGVQHSHRSVLTETFSSIVADCAGPDASHLCVFPSGHVAALCAVLRILVHGTPTVLMDVWNPSLAAQLIDEYAVTVTAGAPVHLAGILDECDRGAASLKSLRVYTIGGATVPAALIARAHEVGVLACRTYGLSEHPTITAVSPNDPLDKRLKTDGRVLPGNDVRIVDDKGDECAAGVDGDILSRGTELFIGYRDPTLDRDALVDGWFRTGDVGHLDGDGYLTVTDRKKDMIIRGGENISSREVEDILATHPRVSEVAAIGAPDDRLGERVAAFVVLRAGDTLTLAEIGDHFKASGVARAKTPEVVRVVAALPRTPSGKVRKQSLRDLLVEQHGQPDVPDLTCRPADVGPEIARERA